MRKCFIAVNGYFYNDASLDQQTKLKERFADYGVTADIIKTNRMPLRIDGEKVVSGMGDYEFGVFLDKDVNTALMLEKAGYRLYNSAEATRLCDDKMLTYISLSGQGINMPRTVTSPLMYRETDDGEFILRVEKIFGYPVVVKKVYGSMGAGVYLANDRAELSELFKKLRLYPHLYQEYIKNAKGTDIRVITVGGKVAAAMRRVNKHDFRSNIELGGVGMPTELTENQRNLAETAVKILGLDYAGVDIINDGENDYLCEINSCAYFKGIENTTKIDIAHKFVTYILKKQKNYYTLL